MSSGSRSADVVNAAKEAWELHSQTALSDLDLLSKLNDAVTKQYEGMGNRAHVLREGHAKLKAEYARLEQCFEAIETLEGGVNQAENALRELDDFSKRLEVAYKAALQEAKVKSTQ